MDHPECHRIVNQVWNSKANSNPLHAFSHLVAHTRSRLISWRSSGMHLLDRDILETGRKIEALENADILDNSQTYDPSHLRALHNRHNAILRQNSLKWAQHARLMWVQNGDLNSSFFTTVSISIGIKPYFPYH